MSSATDVARKILERYWDKTLPVNPTAIAYALGARIVCEPKLGENGYFTFAEDGRTPVIFLNPFDSTARQRFTIFAELGHYAPGHGPGTRTSRQNNNTCHDESTEAAADQFATEMILPADAVLLYANTTRMSIWQMAQLFNVSERAMQLRLERLGII